MLKTADGRSVVMEDPEGKEFPWDPKTFDEIIHGEVINKADETKQWKDIAEDVIGLYFSAHWVSEYSNDYYGPNLLGGL